MAATGTDKSHATDGRVGGKAVGTKGTLVSPSLSVGQVEHYFGDIKGFPAIDTIKNVVPVKPTVANLEPTKAMQYGNHSTELGHMDSVSENEDIRRNRVLVFGKRCSCLF